MHLTFPMTDRCRSSMLPPALLQLRRSGTAKARRCYLFVFPIQRAVRVACCSRLKNNSLKSTLMSHSKAARRIRRTYRDIFLDKLTELSEKGQTLVGNRVL